MVNNLLLHQRDPMYLELVTIATNQNLNDNFYSDRFVLSWIIQENNSDNLLRATFFSFIHFILYEYMKNMVQKTDVPTYKFEKVLSVNWQDVVQKSMFSLE